MYTDTHAADAATGEAPVAEAVVAEEADPRDIYKVPVVKAKGAEIDYLEINIQKLPDHVYREVIAQGLKQVLNRGMTKVTKETYPKADELKTAALAKAQETKAKMLDGTIRIVGAKSEKTSGKVMTEARRIAKNMVKDEMKAQKIKVSQVDAKDITAVANKMIAEDPSIIEQAKANIEAQEAKLANVSGKFNLKELIPVNAKKVAKAEQEKAEAKKSLSAMQAGKTKVRQKPVNA